MIDDQTAEGRQQIIARMRAAARAFYVAAVASGCHAFVEYTGLMNEFIALCQRAEHDGLPWLHANVHGNVRLPFEEYHLAYLNEKLGCIYGVRLDLDEAMASKGGKARAAKLSPKRRSEIARSGGKARAAKRARRAESA